MSQGVLSRAPRVDMVETLHGVTISDPYRPLEDPEAQATRDWVAQQDARTRAVLGEHPARAAAETWYREAWEYPRTSLPARRGDLYFYSFDDGVRAQPEYRVRRGLHGEGRTLIDPNALSVDGTVAGVGAQVSRDGRHVAYLLAEAGSDMQTMRIRNVETGRDLPDVLEYCRWTSCAWDPDGLGFLYNRCPEPEGPDDRSWMRRMLICRHRLGTAQEADDIIVPPGPDGRLIMPFRFRGTPRVGLQVHLGTDERSGFRISRTPDSDDFITVIEPWVASFQPIEVIPEGDRDVLYALTTLDAPKGRIVTIDLVEETCADPQNWRTIVPESDLTILDGHLVRDKLLVIVGTGLESRVEVHRRDGTHLSRLDIPGPSSIWPAPDEPAHPEVLLSASDWLTDGAIWCYNVETETLTRVHINPVKQDLAGGIAETLWATSRDGTRIPMTLVRLPDTPKDGNAPVLMTGYGGFGAPLMPHLDQQMVHWVRRGGIYVTTHLRGGGEFGQAWHDGGRRHVKQNTFDDFIACAEMLVAEGWTRPQRLAIHGGSNGGLLVTACLVQRPDLFGAVVASVPVTDMLRFHLFTAGRFWTSDYGSPDDPEDFAVLRRYSPVHNVKSGEKYPPLLIMTGDHDDRVVPAHAYKFAAAMQETGDPGNIVLLRVETRAGHGMGKPKEKTIAGLADMEAFLAMSLGL